MQVCNTYSTGNMHEDFSVFHYGYLQSGPKPSLLSVDMGPEDGLSVEAEVSRLEKVLQGLQAEEQETIQTPNSTDDAAYRLIMGLRRRRLLALELELDWLQAKDLSEKSELYRSDSDLGYEALEQWVVQAGGQVGEKTPSAWKTQS